MCTDHCATPSAGPSGAHRQPRVHPVQHGATFTTINPSPAGAGWRGGSQTFFFSVFHKCWLRRLRRLVQVKTPMGQVGPATGRAAAQEVSGPGVCRREPGRWEGAGPYGRCRSQLAGQHARRVPGRGWVPPPAEGAGFGFIVSRLLDVPCPSLCLPNGRIFRLACATLPFARPGQPPPNSLLSSPRCCHALAASRRCLLGRRQLPAVRCVADAARCVAEPALGTVPKGTHVSSWFLAIKMQTR